MKSNMTFAVTCPLMPSPQPRRADYLTMFAVRLRHQIRYLAAADTVASHLSCDVIAIFAGNKQMSIKPTNTPPHDRRMTSFSCEGIVTGIGEDRLRAS